MKFLPVIFLILFYSCNKQNEIHILFENAGGLQRGSIVYIKGIQIGRVQSFAIYGDSVEVTAAIDKEIAIYNDAEFIITGNLTGEKFIEIIPGSSAEIAAKGQIFHGSIHTILPDTSALKEIKSGIEKFFSNKPAKQDSILIELRRMNKTLDSLNNQ